MELGNLNLVIISKENPKSEKLILNLKSLNVEIDIISRIKEKLPDFKNFDLYIYDSVGKNQILKYRNLNFCS